MAYKKVNGIEIIERGGSTVSVGWLKSVSEGQAVRGRSGVDKNNTIAMWKEAHGFSVPNHTQAGRKEELMKLKRTVLVEMASSLSIEHEGDANKATIVDLIIKQESED